MSGHLPPDASGPDFTAPVGGHRPAEAVRPRSGTVPSGWGLSSSDVARGPARDEWHAGRSGQEVGPYASGPYASGPYASGPGAVPYGSAAPPGQQPARPPGIAVSMSMTITATLLWTAGLLTAWLIAVASEPQFVSSEEFADTRIGLIINHFSARLLDGLAVPLLGFPVVAFVLAMLLPIRRGWPRLVYTGLAVLSVGWLFVWLRGDWVYAAPAMAYIAIAAALLWSRGTTRWIRSAEPAASSAGIGPGSVLTAPR